MSRQASRPGGVAQPASKEEAIMIANLQKKEDIFSQLNNFLDDAQTENSTSANQHIKVKLKDLNASKAKNKGLSKQIEEIGKAKLREMEQVAKQNLDLKKKIKGLEERIHDLSSSNDNLRSKAGEVATLEQNNKTLIRETDKLKAKAEEDAKLVKELRAQNAEKQRELTAKIDELEARTDENEDLERKLQVANDKVKELGTALEELKVRSAQSTVLVTEQKTSTSWPPSPCTVLER